MSPHADTVALTIDGERIVVPAHTSVAAAILNRGPNAASSAATVWRVRTSVVGQPRGPLCGMGICFECRATVDGQPHERTCQTTVRDGMEIRTDG
jgi:D-hydroxyproline dehydrogenase subunit gamma